MHIILLPGLDGSGLFFEGFRRLLPSSITTQIISYPRDEGLSYSDIVDQIYEQLPRDRDYIILAESFSGPVAIEIATLAPLKLKGLVLVA
ncbi:MAG: alpha/beta hydrolase, partial [Rhizobiales bacterium]|nr:alpha/beta hydrolase [Hyphomicrobiales bacterium]